MLASITALHELRAESAWASLDFISDVHLHAGDMPTFEAWRRYLLNCDADALFILGDLFEAWPGDDAADAPGFAQDCALALAQVSSTRPVFLMHGNRDFLLGDSMAQRCGLRLLPDPTVLDFAGVRWLLSHGDALCLADADYQRFRAEVRAPAWQSRFLAKPLAEREAMARDMRDASQAHQRVAAPWADVDDAAALAWLQTAGARTLIHGHTHRPQTHTLVAHHQRIVLSDWDASATPSRMQALRLRDDGSVQRIELA